MRSWTWSLLLLLWMLSAARAKDEYEIIGQKTLTITQGSSITLQLTDLFIEDADEHDYPDGFELKIHDGDNYTFSGNTITPAASFTGVLKVEVRVRKGNRQSDKFKLKITVNPKPNVAPTITGQQTVATLKGTPVTISFTDLIVNDPDDEYPSGFTMTVAEGNNYQVSGHTITPRSDFVGQLTVPVLVNDGQANSQPFQLKIQVSEPAVQNVPPVITGQSPMSTTTNTAVTISLNHLQVTDPDDSYPSGFTMMLASGNNYTYSGLTVTPAQNFTGTLTVPVTVNDGQANSSPFQFKISVSPAPTQNVAPVITGQQALSTSVNTPITIGFNHLSVTDPDNVYPTGFKLAIGTGSNYSVTGQTITPAQNFTGTLTIPVTVNDGQANSQPFQLKIDVISALLQNVAPVITGQEPLSTMVNVPFTIGLNHLKVTDPDNQYPAGFTLTVAGGSNYSVSGQTITPGQNFTGSLTIPITVNDGKTSSQPFELKLNVTAAAVQNVAPVITGQHPISMIVNTSRTISLSDLIVSDPDDAYPGNFTMTLSNGQNYSLSGRTLVPAQNFSGTLTVPVVVSDGKSASAPFNLIVSVVSENNLAQPVITGQRPLVTYKNQALALTTADLTVNDPQNQYPSGYTVVIGEGANYFSNGSILTPALNFVGDLTVPVTVVSGVNFSDPFPLKITVLEDADILDIPTAFTPNNDNVNDTWLIRTTDTGKFSEATVRVFSKSGVLVFESTGLDRAWDGRLNGELLPADVYFFTIEVDPQDPARGKKGMVTILR